MPIDRSIVKLIVALLLALASTVVVPAHVTSALRSQSKSSTECSTRFIFDGNRVYAELRFLRPDGSAHRTLAFVDMGSPDMTLTSDLFTETQAGQSNAIHFKLGYCTIEVPSAQVQRETAGPFSVNSDLLVEAVLPASVLQRFIVSLDYAQHKLTFSWPGADKPQGVAVPFRINSKTGLIAVNANIDGQPYAITIDNGSAYSWIRGSVAREWLAVHPDWKRATGAVGEANMMMGGDTTESEGALLRVPEISLGALSLKEVGVLAAGPSHGMPQNLDLFDWYARKNAAPVIGWIGGNVLKHFCLTIDYPHRVIYLEKETEPDPYDLDVVGMTLRTMHRKFFVTSIARLGGKPTVKGVLAGDELLRIGKLDLTKASWGQIYAALHGAPGDTRELVIGRSGKRFILTVKITRF